MKKIEKTAIIGMGALGMLFGERIFVHKGPDAVKFILDPERLERYRGKEFTVNGRTVDFGFVKDSESEVCDLVIVAVKESGLQSALSSMEKAVGEDTVIISVMNGISSENFIGEKFGFRNIVYTVAQGMDAVKFGTELNYSKPGELRIGVTETGSSEQLARLEEFFGECGIAFTEEADIMRRLWSKLMLNVGINQTCMIYDLPYGGAVKEGSEANRSFISAMREVIAVAGREGIRITEDDLNQYVALVKTLDPEGMPSMEQDRKSRRRSEVELFSGTVIRYAKKHGIQVPVNEWIYSRVKEIEAGY